MHLQRTRCLVQGGAAGHDIVDEQDALPPQVRSAFERSFDIGLASLERQCHLAGRGACALKFVEGEGQLQSASQCSRNFARLVKSPFGQAQGVQWQRDEAIVITGAELNG